MSNLLGFTIACFLVPKPHQRSRPVTDLSRLKTFLQVERFKCLNGEYGPGGTPSHEALLVSPQGALEISSVIGQPPSLVRDLFYSPRVVANPIRDDGWRPSSQRPQYPIFTDASNEGCCSLSEQVCTRFCGQGYT